MLQLSHKDVNLGFSKPHKDAILCLRSGMPLTYHDHCLCLPSTGRDIAQLSIKMKEKLGKWELKGYKVTAARIRFIVGLGIIEMLGTFQTVEEIAVTCSCNATA